MKNTLQNIINTNRQRRQPIPFIEILAARIQPESLEEGLACHRLFELTSQLESYTDKPYLIEDEGARSFWIKHQAAYTRIVYQGAAQAMQERREL